MVSINLIFIGALQEHHLSVMFSHQKTMLSFPLDHPDLARLSFEATVHCCLLLLDLDFIPALSDDLSFPSTISTLACPVFKITPITTDLWHGHFGHLGQDATKHMLS
jgi:hypothetical protein